MPDEDPSLDSEIESFLGDINSNGTSPEPTDDFFTNFTVEAEPGQQTLTEEDGSPFDGATTEIGDGACVVCGTPVFRPPGLTKAGHRKRVPKFCDLHSPSARVEGTPPLQARLESQLLRVQEELADDLRLGGTLIGAMFPVTGYYIFENADPFTIALMKLCKNNQRALRVLHRAASVAPVYEVAKCGAGVAYAIQVDQKKADPHNSIGHRLGVSRAYDSVYPSDTPQTYTMGSNNQSTAPPRYAGIQ